jgi:hypothetical protein
MIYMWLTGINYYKLAVEKDRYSIFTTIWKPNLYERYGTCSLRNRCSGVKGNECA